MPCLQVRDGRADHFNFFAAHAAVLAGMRIEACDGDARAGNAEIVCAMLDQRPRPASMIAFAVSAEGTSFNAI